MKITYCMMTWNRLYDTMRAIERVKPYVDRVVVVDGGSTDDTILTLRNYDGVELYLHPWEDNFPKQRTNYLNHAGEDNGGTDWILVSDPDELYSKAALENMRNEIDNCGAYNMLALESHSVSMHGPKIVNHSHDKYWKALLFKWNQGIHYVGNPHETLVIDGGIRVKNIPYHYYHIKQDNITWHRGCFTGDTRIFTTGGYKEIQDIRSGDFVIDMNGDTKKVTEALKRYVKNETMYKIKRPGAMDVHVTGEHPFFVSPGDNCKERGKEFLAYPRKYNNSCSCCQKDKIYTDFNWKNVSELNKLTVNTFPRINYKEKIISGPKVFVSGNQYKQKLKQLPVDSKLAYLCGVYVAEGHVESSAGNDNFDRVGFSLNSKEKDTIGKELSKIIKDLFGNSSWYKKSIEKRNNNACTLLTSVKHLGNWLVDTFGKGAVGKKIPYDFVCGLTNEILCSFLRGLFDGDGCLKSTGSRLSMCSADVIGFVYLALVRLGIRPSIYKISLETLNNSNNGIQHKHDMFYIDIIKDDETKFRNLLYNDNLVVNCESSHKIWTTSCSMQSGINDIEQYGYSGFVYNLEVEDTESYLIPYMTVHNCRNFHIGGGGPNLGDRNEWWVTYKEVLQEVYGEIPSWHKMEPIFLAGNIDQRLKEWMYKAKDVVEINGQADGSSEVREVYKTYYRIFHPEEEPEEFRGVAIG